MPSSDDTSPRQSRRSFLRNTLAAGTAVAITGTAGCLYSGAEFNLGPGTGPGLGQGRGAAGGVGSGFAYEEPDLTEADTDVTVTNADQLSDALASTSPNDILRIWIPPDAAIDFTGRDGTLEHGVIASTRSTDHPGGMIYSNSMGKDSSAWSGGSGIGTLEFGRRARMTGVRYRGPTSSVWDHELYPGFIPYGSGGSSARANFREERFSRGIRITHGEVRIDNCELFGWSVQAISVGCPRSWKRDQEQSYPRIQNCSIHDCGLSGYGYGVEIDTGHPLIENCYMNGCRHMVAGEGWPDCGYTLSNCFLGPAGSSFPIDMHYLGENTGTGSSPDDYDYRYHSGELIRILNNTVAFSHVIDTAKSSSLSAGGLPNAGNRTSAIVIGGLPSEGVVVQGNAFVHDSMSSAITQSNIPGHADVGGNDFARIDVSDNQYGYRPGYSVGQP